MQRRSLLLVVFALGFLTPPAARAILIEAGGMQVGGYVISNNGMTLKIRVIGPDGEKNLEFERAKIKIIHQLDRTKLEKLSKDQPQGYADLAEAFAAHKQDPEARDVAMRLFLIAAYLDQKQFAARSLMRMSLLAASPEEARRCKAMAFLLDPTMDATALRVAAVKPPAKAQSGPLQDFLKTLQHFRAGQVDRLKQAKEMSERLNKLFAAAPGIGSQASFQRLCNDAFCSTCGRRGVIKCSLCKGTGVSVSDFGQQQLCTKCKGKRLPGFKFTVTTCDVCDGQGVNQAIIDENLRNVLRAELWALDQLAGGANAGKRGEASWSSVIDTRQVSPAGTLSLETITEFDPRKCVYRGGVWVAP
ncbi:MAG: hypothetical protein FJ271_09845 [Planctomycetes bacterium]|nr:hypothetical protein [Planctomycetota bacterium]